MTDERQKKKNNLKSHVLVDDAAAFSHQPHPQCLTCSTAPEKRPLALVCQTSSVELFSSDFKSNLQPEFYFALGLMCVLSLLLFIFLPLLLFLFLPRYSSSSSIRSTSRTWRAKTSATPSSWSCWRLGRGGRTSSSSCCCCRRGRPWPSRKCKTNSLQG